MRLRFPIAQGLIVDLFLTGLRKRWYCTVWNSSCELWIKTAIRLYCRTVSTIPSTVLRSCFLRIIERQKVGTETEGSRAFHHEYDKRLRQFLVCVRQNTTGSRCMFPTVFCTVPRLEQAFSLGVPGSSVLLLVYGSIWTVVPQVRSCLRYEVRQSVVYLSPFPCRVPLLHMLRSLKHAPSLEETGCSV